MNDFFRMFVIFLGTMLMCAFLISAVDLAFNTAQNINYLTTLKVNLLSVLLFIVILILCFVFAFNVLDFLGDTGTTIAALILALFITYFIKSYLLQSYGIELSFHFLVTFLGLFLFAGPIYLVYRMLRSFGKAFMH